jgi:hypothetical protein
MFFLSFWLCDFLYFKFPFCLSCLAQILAKNDGEKWSRTFFFENHQAPSEIPANLPCQFSLIEQIFLNWAAATLKGLGEFQKKSSRPLFNIIFKQKMSISRLEILVHLYKMRPRICVININ